MGKTYQDEYWNHSRPLRSAIQSINDAMARGESIVIRFDLVDTERAPQCDLQVETGDGEHIYSDLSYMSFEEALIEAGDAIGKRYNERLKATE